MQFYKYVSGKGRVALSEEEKNELFSKEPIKVPASRLDKIEAAIGKIVSFFEKLGFKVEGLGDEDGNS